MWVFKPGDSHSNPGFVAGVVAVIAVGTGILSMILNDSSSAPSIRGTRQELGLFLN